MSRRRISGVAAATAVSLGKVRARGRRTGQAAEGERRHSPPARLYRGDAGRVGQPADCCDRAARIEPRRPRARRRRRRGRAARRSRAGRPSSGAGRRGRAGAARSATPCCSSRRTCRPRPGPPRRRARRAGRRRTACPAPAGGTSASVGTCARGTTSTWPLNTGRASRNAATSSSRSDHRRGRLARRDRAEDAARDAAHPVTARRRRERVLEARLAFEAARGLLLAEPGPLPARVGERRLRPSRRSRPRATPSRPARRRAACSRAPAAASAPAVAGGAQRAHLVEEPGRDHLLHARGDARAQRREGRIEQQDRGRQIGGGRGAPRSVVIGSPVCS